MQVILNKTQIKEVITDLANQVIENIPAKKDIAVIGIRSRGEILGYRLAKVLSEKLKHEVPCGTLDITLYRDDLNRPQSQDQPQVRTTEISFDIDDKIIILADDVLYTGRSVRAAMDALIDLGRPEAIRLAVMVDRSGREFPIQADYAGYRATVTPDKKVIVNFEQADGKDRVCID